jgi:phenylacetate-CoA ligase
MAFDRKMELYWLLPVWLQEIALSIYARHLDKVYYNDTYEEWKNWLINWKSWKPSFVEEWKSERLQHIVAQAAGKVPYYKKAYKSIAWNQIKSDADLHVLPTLDKQSIRQNEHAFIVDDIDAKKLWVEKTSGTTGTSLKIYWPMTMVARWAAIMEVIVRYEAGVAQEVPRATMGGRPIVRGNATRPPYWRFNRRWNQLYLSSYHVSKNNALGYIAALRKYGISWITGYGSAIAALAESSLDAGIDPYQLRSVIVSGDTLLKGMRLSIEKYFQCRCFDHYGQCEGVAMAFECNQGQMHVIPWFGIIEILREDGTPCEPGETGEIVGTSLLNDAMPLIRYRTGDYAAWSKVRECQCGNHNPIITHLEGRVDNYLVTEDGRKVGRLSTAMKRSPAIHSAQIVQDKPGHACLLIRPGDGYQSSDASAVCDDILKRIGKFDLDVVEVSEIPKTPQGKTVLVVRLKDRPAMREIYEKLLNKKF